MSNNIHTLDTETSKEGTKSKSVMMTNPCIDSVFQYGFQEPSILSDFLNAALNFTGENAIEDITYLPRDITASDPLSSFAYHFTVDIRCRTKNNHHFLIEMQNDFITCSRVCTLNYGTRRCESGHSEENTNEIRTTSSLAT